MMESLRRLIFALFVLALAFALFGLWRKDSGEYGLLNLLRGEKPTQAEYTAPTEPRLDLGEVALLSRLDDEYSKLAASVLPAVVSVTTKTVRQGGYGWHPFFGLVGTQAQVIPGLGSGAIISKEGHVVTNFHVIEGVNEVMVTTQDKKSYPARFLGANRQRDIAVLKIESNKTDFPALSFADSDAVRVGQLVMAVGNPFGLSGTVTRGIISARDRHLSDSSLDYLQTDAVINPGNSGGPLVNVRGEILGINVAIYRGDENVRAWQGVGLAVPAKDTQAVIKSVLNREKEVVPGYLGIEVAAETVRLERQQLVGALATGALVTAVLPGSPAVAAGIVPGDVILAFNGEPVKTPSGLLKSIQSLPAGHESVILLVRGGNEVELSARLAARPVGN
jgi:S1-C subfamily serine protease